MVCDELPLEHGLGIKLKYKRVESPVAFVRESSNWIKVFVMRPQTRETVNKLETVEDLKIFMKSEN